MPAWITRFDGSSAFPQRQRLSTHFYDRERLSLNHVNGATESGMQSICKYQ